ALIQPRDMEKDVASTVVRAEETEAFVLKVSHDRAGFGGRRFRITGCGAASAGRSRTAGFVAHPLLDEGKIVLGPVGNRLRGVGHFQVRILLACVFKKAFLSSVQVESFLNG